MRDKIDQPWVSNYPVLDTWLRKHEAQCDRQVPLGSATRPRGYWEQWRFPNGHHCIVLVMADQRGWDVYTPHQSGKIEATLADAEARMGIAASEGSAE